MQSLEFIKSQLDAGQIRPRCKAQMSEAVLISSALGLKEALQMSSTPESGYIDSRVSKLL